MAATTRAFCLVALAVASLAFHFLDGSAAAGDTAGRSTQRRRQVRSLLRRLNKAPLASIQSPDGDTIDCVHISKQPAFDHPFLKNHTIQNGQCPENTIPIRRTKEEDVLRASSVRRFGKKRPRSIPNLVSSVDNSATPNVLVGHQHAVASTWQDKYYGTSTVINLWEPTLERPNDFSLAQLWITGGSYGGNDLNTIEAGWQVSQSMYGDKNTRLFIYWTSDAYQKTGCYNLCPGFVQTNNQIAIGGSISPVSIYGGSQYDISILIWKDPQGGNWWLKVGGSILGYWPSSMFSYLADTASVIMWGGEVYSPDAGQTSTQMGSGHFPEEGFGKSSYMKNIQVVDSSNNLKSPNGVGLRTEQPNCYNKPQVPECVHVVKLDFPFSPSIFHFGFYDKRDPPVRSSSGRDSASNGPACFPSQCARFTSSSVVLSPALLAIGMRSTNPVHVAARDAGVLRPGNTFKTRAPGPIALHSPTPSTSLTHSLRHPDDLIPSPALGYLSHSPRMRLPLDAATIGARRKVRAAASSDLRSSNHCTLYNLSLSTIHSYSSPLSLA
ncbi:hypothetical protein BS78_04G117400 [Paspalum vaginatum]|nr:hypothetical protein BS78_04G117400 [Paspalum vaginatum]